MKKIIQKITKTSTWIIILLLSANFLMAQNIKGLLPENKDGFETGDWRNFRPHYVGDAADWIRPNFSINQTEPISGNYSLQWKSDDREHQWFMLSNAFYLNGTYYLYSIKDENKIGVYTSPNGVDFTHQNTIEVGIHAHVAAFYEKKTGLFHLYSTAGFNGVNHAVSSDGIHFDFFTNVMNPSPVERNQMGEMVAGKYGTIMFTIPVQQNGGKSFQIIEK